MNPGPDRTPQAPAAPPPVPALPPSALVIGPTLAFALVIFVASWSGNDKAPFLVLALLALLALLLVVSLAVGVFGGPRARRAWALAAGAALPLACTAVVVLLSRAGWIDAARWLGFS